MLNTTSYIYTCNGKVKIQKQKRKHTPTTIFFMALIQCLKTNTWIKVNVNARIHYIFTNFKWDLLLELISQVQNNPSCPQADSKLTSLPTQQRSKCKQFPREVRLYLYIWCEVQTMYRGRTRLKHLLTKTWKLMASDVLMIFEAWIKRPRCPIFVNDVWKRLLLGKA